MKEPIYKKKIGQIDGTIWVNEREGKKGTFKVYSPKIVKSYLIEGGDAKKTTDWKETTNFQVDELPVVTLVAQDLYKYCKENKSELREQ